MNKNKYLPIGTVVRLNSANKDIMIIGYGIMDETESLYDYSAVLYPEGNIDVENLLIFNHEQIETIKFMGYETNESKEYSESLHTAINYINKKSDE